MKAQGVQSRKARCDPAAPKSGVPRAIGKAVRDCATPHSRKSAKGRSSAAHLHPGCETATAARFVDFKLAELGAPNLQWRAPPATIMNTNGAIKETQA
jgi:hypothetical protein